MINPYKQNARTYQHVMEESSTENQIDSSLCNILIVLCNHIRQNIGTR